MQKKEYSVEIGGKILTAIFSNLAEQAHGSVILKYGETIVLATACMSKDRQDGLGFFNLTVDYLEKYYAVGKILGSRFMHREGKPSEDAVLACRVIDRTLRPLFDQSMRHAVQIIVSVLSLDQEDPTILAVNAASLALAVSDIPWAGPVGAVRIGKYDSDILTVSPAQSLREDDSKYKFDLTICGKGGNINMIEAASHQVREEELEEAFKKASEEITKLEDFQKKIVAEIGIPKRVIEKEKISEESIKLFNENILPKMEGALFYGVGKKKIDELHSIWNKMVKDNYPDRKDFSPEDDLFDNTENEMLHKKAIDEDKRADGRKMDELRDLYAQAGGLSSILHGSGIFYRGGTHVLSVLTLGGPEDKLLIDGMEAKEEKRFMHHYNFPPYSGGEVGRTGNTNRREVGHGALAEKALAMVLPSVEEFPYTMRLVSESMASNGSTSQASICASVLALMDGGVPIKAPVGGIAMGLMMESITNEQLRITKEPRYKILTDIQGPEDHHGDMDFKVAGTREGVTAIQLDVKVEGVPIKILAEAMIQAKIARLAIIDRIEKEIPKARTEISKNAPKILIIKIKPDQIGMVIGGGGKTIKDIKERTGAEITIEDDGTVYLTGKDDKAEMAKKIIEEMTHEFNIGEILKGEVVRIADFGAFVRLNPFTDGMVHISEMAPFRVERVSDIIKEGMIVPVKILKVDREQGKISLSIKEADKDFFAPKK
ncbi:MAG: Polyribonucleotide nucleotidyltransferase [Candidatus Nomurabacteria bacterium GW2011_GWE1_32_28]|uniref:Polyribonucleotide nucleotidyltransferase n=1 Tax=Candidatus Nomurabacteria bacterium GW2011_GWF1_31_48 TaxID=1618767 RepID=A0A0F9YG39_9BACT|nr:MAG: Polyribonucleotide nucleotidyltransferase [Candidatus Nomurabacteria bacterium GW2011_GWF2_30_133]KKP28820.1 MAG: Polyribonucleotide nucleotidyltransferase [Candidatus Nomurabacteria bacterium GW2011_GWE2_31_40]KKP30398.1 MAG: Polyribonucleotide nucleotidyltransferase [Candidatus Nomurabacteria bacterium GW2011_GWF1_31_48]KKP34925.1 MAG: Polyribonucleotide nucleotidyltransferase [Candidatus Nomurabacteria bacterium GW2011_GWE1_32_28]HAS81016.1 polyribonucleotide nucleotidyltransferase [